MMVSSQQHTAEIHDGVPEISRGAGRGDVENLHHGQHAPHEHGAVIRQRGKWTTKVEAMRLQTRQSPRRERPEGRRTWGWFRTAGSRR